MISAPLVPGPFVDPGRTISYVRFWHKADIPVVLLNVRFRE